MCKKFVKETKVGNPFKSNHFEQTLHQSTVHARDIGQRAGIIPKKVKYR